MSAALKRSLIAVAWIGSGYVAHGFMLGGECWEFPAQGHEPSATLISYAAPPVGIGVGLLTGGMYHYRQHDMTCQQRWEAYKMDSPFQGPHDKEWFVHWANPDCDPEELR